MVSNSEQMKEIEALRSLFFREGKFMEAAEIDREGVRKMGQEMDRLARVAIQPEGPANWLGLSHLSMPLSRGEKLSCLSITLGLMQQAANLFPIVREVERRSSSFPFLERGEIDWIETKYRVCAFQFLASLEALRSVILAIKGH